MVFTYNITAICENIQNLSPRSLLEGNIDVADKGACINYKNLVDSEVMGSTADKQRSLNQSWNNTETVSVIGQHIPIVCKN